MKRRTTITKTQQRRHIFDNQWQQPAPQQGLGEQVYDGAASLGLFMATIGFIFGGLIGLVLVIWGVTKLGQKKKLEGEVQGKVTEANCDTSDPKNGVKCNLKLAYTINGKDYSIGASTADGVHNVGAMMDIDYDVANPETAELSSMSPRTIGMIMIGVGLFLIGATGVNWYIARNYKFAAAATGVGTAAGIVSDAISD